MLSTSLQKQPRYKLRSILSLNHHSLSLANIAAVNAFRNGASTTFSTRLVPLTTTTTRSMSAMATQIITSSRPSVLSRSPTAASVCTAGSRRPNCSVLEAVPPLKTVAVGPSSATRMTAQGYRHHSNAGRPFHTQSLALAQPYFAMKNSTGETLRVHLTKSRHWVGIRSTRCQSKYNQDRYKVSVLNPMSPATVDAPPAIEPTDQLAETETGVAAGTAAPQPNGKENDSQRATKARSGTPLITTTQDNDNDSNISNGTNGNTNTLPQYPASSTARAKQLQVDADQKSLFYFAIFDGHGGSHVADYITAHLDRYIEQANPSQVPQVIKALQNIGGYFRSFCPPLLEKFIPAGLLEQANFERRKQQQQQRKVHVKGKSGVIKPLIFIEHPNAAEQQGEDRQGGWPNGVESFRQATMPMDTFDQSLVSVWPLSEEDESVRRYEEYKRQGMEDRAREKALTGLDSLPPNSPKGETALVDAADPMTLEQKLCLGFLKCDTDLIERNYKDGSTASVAILQSKGAFWETEEDMDLIIAHVGDTRILYCEAPKGEAVQLTTDHHPQATVESDRIRKMSGYISSDSFGESMFMGRLANTRSLGDTALKPFGVTAEPEIIRKTINSKHAAFLVLMSDGISSVMSNQEVVDCVKMEDDPTLAATKVLNLAEQLGAYDNCTIVVVKLPGWGTHMPDLTKDLRAYRWETEGYQVRSRRR